MRTLEAIREAGARVHEIVLAPLGLDDVGRLVADALHCEPERARPLAQLVQEKTGGNPFFAIQFLIALADEGLLAFDSVAAAWAWDIDRIRAKNYTDNVVDLMVRKLKRLSFTTQDALKHLACLGNMAEIGTLSLGSRETPRRRCTRHSGKPSAPASSSTRVMPTSSCMTGSSRRRIHCFLKSAAPTVHLRIGRVLLASMTADAARRAVCSMSRTSSIEAPR